MASRQILALWDAFHEKGAFPYSSFGYSEKFTPFDVVLSVYRGGAGSRQRWALVFEQIGFWYIDCPSSASSWVRVIRDDSDPEEAFGKDDPSIVGVVTTDEVTNDPAAEQTDEECIAEATADAEGVEPRCARLQELTVNLDGAEHVLRPSLDDWRFIARADVGPVSYAGNRLAPHLELFRLATRVLRERILLADPRDHAGLDPSFELVFRDDGPDPIAHLGESPRRPSDVPYFRALAALCAGETSAVPSRASPLDRAIRRALAIADDAEIPEGRLGEIKTLNLGDSRATDLAGIERLINLEVLHGYRTNIATLAPLAPLARLREVGFAWTPVEEISALAGKKALSQVDLSYTRVSDVSALRDAPLRDLRVSGSDVTDLAPLGDRKIAYLACDDTPAANGGDG